MRRSFALTLIGVLVWTAIDAAAAALEAGEPALEPAAWGLAVAAPWALLAGAAASLVARGAERLRALVAPWVGSVAPRPGGEPAPGGPRATAAAWGALPIAAALGLAVGLSFAVTVGSALVGAIRTPLYAAAGVLIGGALGALLAAGAATAAFPWVERAVHALSRHPALAAALRPTRVVAIATAGLVAAVVAWVSGTSLVDGLPWPRLGAATLVGLVLLASAVASTRGGLARRSLDRVGRPLTVLALAALAVALVPERGGLRASLSRQRSLATGLLRASDWVSDLDRDGAPSLYGGGDCAPLDRRRGPHVAETADNGVDEDCSGRDANSSTLPFEPGKRRHPRSAPLPVARRPHVILVTTDALSYDHTGLGGYPRSVTPRLDAWARRATVFDRAFATSSSTANALPALLSGTLITSSPGLLPPQNQASAGGRAARTLPELLRAAGYKSVALPGTRILSVEQWPSLMAAFDEVDVAPLSAAERRTSAPKPYAAPDLAERALSHLDAAAGRPLLLWVHFFDHHPPYQLPPDTKPFGERASELDRYDTELAFADRHWGALLEGVEARLSPADYVMLFTADHGEAFDRMHPRGRHDQSLHTAETHVPFVVQTPAQRGARRAGLASHLDVVPTVLDLLELEPDADLPGESLTPALFGAREPEKSFVTGVLWQPRGAPFGSPALRSAMLRTADWLYIDDRERGQAGLFEPAADPLGLEDRSHRNVEEAEWARWALRKALGTMPTP